MNLAGRSLPTPGFGKLNRRKIGPGRAGAQDPQNHSDEPLKFHLAAFPYAWNLLQYLMSMGYAFKKAPPLSRRRQPLA